MKHIFFVNSNITSICAYDSIHNLRKEGCNVIVLLVRGTKWQFEKDATEIIDLSKLLKFLHNNFPKTRSISSIFKSRILYNRTRQFVERLVCGDEYIMYIPQYHSILVSAFCENSLCRGYYYLEEGVGAYASINWNKETMGYNTLYRIVSLLTGIPYHFTYHINRKMKGVIALNENAFPWYKGEKIVNKFDNINIEDSYKKRRIIIILPPLTGCANEIVYIIGELISYLKDSKYSLAIKFHPRTGNEERNNLNTVLNSLAGKNVDVLSDDFIVEFNLMAEKSVIYSVEVKSSLLVYAINFGREAYFVHRTEQGVKIEAIKSIHDTM